MSLMYPNKKFILKLKTGTDWYKINTNQTGFYRVNYDDQGWKLIIKQLETDHTVFISYTTI